MKCEEARLRIGAEPSEADPVLEAHLAGCADCTAYQREMRRIDGDLHRALDWPREGAVGGGLPTQDEVLAARDAAGTQRAPTAQIVPLRADGPAAALRGAVPPDAAPDAGELGRRAGTHASAHGAPVPAARRWAFAAVVLLVGVLAASFLALQPGTALATDVVAHMGEEPEAWAAREPVPPPLLDAVLRRSGVRLDRVAAGEVVYAHSCFLRGRQVPHLVVQSGSGPVTVLVLRGEEVPRREAFDERGYQGLLLPVPGGGGAIAVLSRASADGAATVAEPELEAVATRVLRAVAWDESVDAGER